MTQEEKDLLLKDLSSRLPYQPLCKKVDTEDDFCECDGLLGYSLRDLVNNKIIIKPYLRPMSSMTEEEKRELQSFFPGSFGNQYLDLDKETIKLFECNSTMELDLYNSVQIVDFCKKNHLDYYGLIEKGLALSTEEFNPYKD